MTTLTFTPRGIRVLTGVNSVVDRVVRRLRFFRGEWLFNSLLGVSYNDLFESQNNLNEVLDVLKFQVEDIEGVVSAVLNIRDFTPESRVLHLDVHLETTFGVADVGVDI